MDAYEESLHTLYDERISTLGNIKLRSIGADVLTLTALRVLVYAQLEGGVKDLASIALRYINARRMQFDEIAPSILEWRNAGDLGRFKAAVTFSSIATAFPFGGLPKKPVKLRPINRIHEFNQMDWESIAQIYDGLGLNLLNVLASSTLIKDLVKARNDAAHYGALPNLTRTLLEGQVRQDAIVVETVLTDLTLQLLTYFAERRHCRPVGT